jgi:fibronectin type 3 domain-containing protein
VGAVRLSWRPSPDPDVAVYIVYRAESGRDFVRIGSARPPAVAYTDRDLPSGRYQYVITAQDAGSRANESERSNVVTVTVP